MSGARANPAKRRGSSAEGLIVGIDVGGTFADVICVGRHGLHMRKTPSRPDAPGADVMEGLRQIADGIGYSTLAELLAETDVIFHGSTIATNTLLTLTGDPVGLITTSGFRDIVEMRGGRREATFNSHLENAPPLARRDLRVEVLERTDRTGLVTDPPDRAAVIDAADGLLAGGAQAIAIAFKHSSANPANEQAAASWVQSHAPDIFVTNSAELSRRPRLYDRTSSAVVNAYVGPATIRYLESLKGHLRQLGFAGELLIMGGSGGVLSVREATRMPVSLILSGPAAGPVGATLSLPDNASPDAVLVDMGGTSFDVSVLRGGAVATTTSRDVNRYRIGVPMLDIHTIGAGGGSIASVDSVGLLRVGPASAGAIPGPAAYGLGGLVPTVTDANLVLGLLTPTAMLGNARRLSLPLARRAVAKVARRVGLSPEECAAGIRAVANGSMVAAVREMTVGRGLDPRGLALIAGGGAGPLHAAEIAADLGIATVIIPSHAGVLCAVGMAVSNLEFEAAIGVVRPIDEIDRQSLRRALVEVRTQLRLRLRSASQGASQPVARLECEARYEGQFHELLIPTRDRELVGNEQASFIQRFHAAHEAAYGFRSDSARIEIVNLRVKQVGTLRMKPRLRIQQTRSGVRLMATGQRLVLLRPTSPAVAVPVLVPIHADGSEPSLRSSPPRGSSAKGPALIDLPTSTVFVPPGWSFRMTRDGDIRLTRHPRRAPE